MIENQKTKTTISFGLNSECRQHIGLSLYSFRVIENDMISFNYDKTRRNHSGFLNIIFNHYYEAATFSLPKLVELHNQWMADLYSIDQFKRNFSGKKAILDDILLERRMFDAIKGLPKYPKDHPFKWKIDKQNATIIEGLDEAKFFADYGMSLYLKAIFEEYCRLSFPERERIFFKDKISLIEEAIAKKRMIKISTIEGEKIEIAPYKTYTAHNKLHCELVGIEHTREMESYAIVNIAIMDIEKIKMLISKSSSTVSRLGNIMEDITTRPEVASSSTRIQTFRIKFTETGLKQYMNDIDHRPYGTMATEDDREKLIFTFTCLESEIVYYFFKYGALFQVLEPTETREIMKSLYEEAYKNYANI